MSILLALAVPAFAVPPLSVQGVSYAAPPLVSHARPRRDVLVIRQGGFNRYPGYRAIGRGGFVPSYWAHPGFTIVQPGFYGFSQPYGGRRWIRYYDDALLVDRHGRVHDGRYGHDWRRYGTRWGHDRRGIPIYVGNGDYHPDGREYAWAERFERGEEGELAYDRDYPYDFRYGGGVASTQYRADAPCAYPCGYTITETTITEPAGYREVTTYDAVRAHRPTKRVTRSKTVRR